jgi:hypothetical protein
MRFSLWTGAVESDWSKELQTDTVQLLAGQEARFVSFENLLEARGLRAGEVTNPDE